MVEDRWPGEGPLGGIITALSATATEPPADVDWNLMVSCDMPFLTREWLSYLDASARWHSDAEVVVPRSEHGLEPLCACWRTPPSVALQVAFDGGTAQGDRGHETACAWKSLTRRTGNGLIARDGFSGI